MHGNSKQLTDVFLLEFATQVPLHESGFANTAFTNQNQLELWAIKVLKIQLSVTSLSSFHGDCVTQQGTRGEISMMGGGVVRGCRSGKTLPVREEGIKGNSQRSDDFG